MHGASCILAVTRSRKVKAARTIRVAAVVLQQECHRWSCRQGPRPLEIHHGDGVAVEPPPGLGEVVTALADQLPAAALRGAVATPCWPDLLSSGGSVTGWGREGGHRSRYLDGRRKRKWNTNEGIRVWYLFKRVVECYGCRMKNTITLLLSICGRGIWTLAGTMSCWNFTTMKFYLRSRVTDAWLACWITIHRTGCIWAYHRRTEPTKFWDASDLTISVLILILLVLDDALYLYSWLLCYVYWAHDAWINCIILILV